MALSMLRADPGGGRGHGGSGWSLWSTDSFLSIASQGSVLSIGSVGSVLSIGSVGSAGSVLSVGSFASLGSALSSLSRTSLLSHGARSQVMGRPSPEVPPPVAVWAVGLGATFVGLLARWADRRAGAVATGSACCDDHG
jgi:hypothetical protein